MRNVFKKGMSTAIALSMAASMSVIIPVTASADNTLSNGTFTFTVNGNNATITGFAEGAEISGTLTIPATITATGDSTSYNVQWIGTSSFTGNTNITGLDLSGATNLYAIGDYAFKNCTNLKGTVSLPDPVRYVRTQAFAYSGVEHLELLGQAAFTSNHKDQFVYCTSLQDIDMGKCTAITQGCFKGCSNLTNVTCPDVTSIRDSAFQGAGSLTSINKKTNDGVDINDLSDITSIGKLSFYGTALTGEIDISGLTAQGLDDETGYDKCLGASAFRGLDGVTKVTLGTTCGQISPQPFYDCSALMAFELTGTNPDRTVREGMLYDCEGTELLLCPTGISGHVDIPEGTTAIGAGAFFTNRSVTSVTIPDSVESVEPTSFERCEKLENIAVDPDNPNFSATNEGVLIKNIKDEDGNVIGKELTKVPNAAESVTIPDDVTSAAEGAVSADSSTNITYNGSSSDVVAKAAEGSGTVTASNPVAAFNPVLETETVGEGDEAVTKLKVYVDNSNITNDKGATGFRTNITNNASNNSTLSKITWTVTSSTETNNPTRSFSVDGKNWSFNGSAGVELFLVISGLYDDAATATVSIQ